MLKRDWRKASEQMYYSKPRNRDMSSLWVFVENVYYDSEPHVRYEAYCDDWLVGSYVTLQEAQLSAEEAEQKT